MESTDQYFTGDVERDSHGISVRDKLAESAMIGILSSFNYVSSIDEQEEKISIMAYKIADAMINKSKQPLVFQEPYDIKKMHHSDIIGDKNDLIS
jgi:hypothetical protein